MQEIIGIPKMGREGLDIGTQYYNKSSNNDRIQMSVKRVEEKEQHQRVAKMTTLSQQVSYGSCPEKKRRKTLSVKSGCLGFS